MTETTNTHQPTFHGLGLAPGMLAILERLKFTTPTPIQHRAIPAAVEGKDVVGIAQTGTGKTLAFGLPAIQRLAQTKGRALILLPTRELALQVDESLAKLGAPLGLRTAVLIGGASMGPQLSALRKDPHIIIATPGRLIDHMEQKTAKLDRVSILVLDEADRMLDMGFWPQIKRIISVVPKERQTMLFSATLSKEIMELATKNMKTPTRIEVAPQGTTAERVTQEIFIVKKEDKLRLLEKILSQYNGSTIVFSRTKHGATKIMRVVKKMGHTAAEIHGNRSLGQRRDALDGFKTGRYRVLIATDIAARGIDVKGIELVINFDLPAVASDYVHRIGRTARAGAEGHAISFAMPAEQYEVRQIERLIRKPLPVTKLPTELPPHRPAPAHIEEPERPRSFASRRPVHASGSQGPRRFGGGKPRRFGSRPGSARKPFGSSPRS
jgi:ATP-dependent RNA helicase RhlE